MSKNDKAVIAWLDSPEGQRWSRNAHNEPGRGIDGVGAFGELKPDDTAAPMDTGSAFRAMARRGERRG